MALPDASGMDDPHALRLVDELFHVFGLDYRGWAAPILERRIAERVRVEGVADAAELRARVLDDRACLERLVIALSVRPRGPFGDVRFAKTMREELLPRLRTYPSIRIWHVGCSTGEDVYGTAILLREAGLWDRTLLYATDVSEILVAHAKSGVSMGSFAHAAADYTAAGGATSLAEYYVAHGDGIAARPLLRQRITFAAHDFASDASFNEFHLIVCRGILSQFGSALQERARGIVQDSLCRFGHLALAPGEALLADPEREFFEPVPWGVDIYRRVR